MALDAAVVFVSAGMFEPKKRDHALARRQLYLNYGALSLARPRCYPGCPVPRTHLGPVQPRDDSSLPAGLVFRPGPQLGQPACHGSQEPRT
jgi:hypothetical protein